MYWYALKWVRAPLSLLTWVLVSWTLAFVMQYHPLLLIPVFILLSVGAGLNLFVVQKNGGRMPVYMFNTWTKLKIDASPELHCVMTETSRYTWLADILRMRIGRKNAVVFAIGDCLMVVSMLLYIVVLAYSLSTFLSFGDD